MLSAHNTPSKSRPMPPAKMRRARTPSLPIQPPPPYAPPGPDDMILNSPVGVTAQLVGARSPNGMKGGQNIPSAMEDWMIEKSRTELSNLLVAAGDLIKSRETELGLTSTLCKNLYQENYTLKTKHDALLARIPGRDTSPVPSPTRSLSPLPLSRSPLAYGGSRPNSPDESSPILSRHVRRVSVTPGELSLLADQNAELLDKLEKLEEESAQADLAGKRKLRKLEKEISGLRAELDKTREKGEELEQNLKKRGIGLTAEEEEVTKRKREEREERLKALREKAGSSVPTSEPSLQEVKDFAPAPELPRVRRVSNPKAPVINFGTKPSAPPPIPEETPQPSSAPVSASESSSYFPVSASASNASFDGSQSTPQLEYALIAQLLSKIRELEDTNRQITQDQKSTADRMQAAQRDAESIRRAYNCLEDEDGELQIIAEEGEEESAPGVSTSPPSHRVPTGNTVKFSSLRRSIDGDVSKLELMEDPREEFANGIGKQSTTRSTLGLGEESPLQQKGKIASQKARKSVVGLFDAKSAGEQNTLSPLYPPQLTISPGFRALSPIPFPNGPVDTSAWSNEATDGFEDHSPSSSPGSPSPSVYASPLLTLTASNLELLPGDSLTPATGEKRMHTLGSELGSEFGDDWGEKAGNHHLRASSIADMSAFWQKDTSGAGRSSSPIGALHLALPSPGGSPQSDSVWEDVDESPHLPAPSARSGSTSGTEMGTPTKSRNSNGLQLQLVVEPPTPSQSKILRHSPSFRGSPLAASVSTSAIALRESRSSRNLRLSQTVKARTSRWVERVERRYMESPFVADDTTPSQALMMRRRRSLMGGKRQRKTSTAMDDTFEEVAHAISRSFSGSAIDRRRLTEDDQIDGDCGSALRREVALPKVETAVVVAKKKQGFVGFVLEVWLWLQFAIVVCVFLWAMARRGPKSVLEDADRKIQRSRR